MATFGKIRINIIITNINVNTKTINDASYERLPVKIKQYLNFAAVVEKSISFVFCI